MTSRPPFSLHNSIGRLVGWLGKRGSDGDQTSPIRGVTPILNVSHVPSSIEWFEGLGWRRGFTWNDGGVIGGAELKDAHGEAHFGSVCAVNAQIFLCKDGQGGKGESGMWISWWIENKGSLDRLYDEVVRGGHEVTRPIADEPWGVREFHLRHPDGHTFRISSGID